MSSVIVEHLLKKNERLVDVTVQHLWRSAVDMDYSQVRYANMFALMSLSSAFFGVGVLGSC